MSAIDKLDRKLTVGERYRYIAAVKMYAEQADKINQRPPFNFDRAELLSDGDLYALYQYTTRKLMIGVDPGKGDDKTVTQTIEVDPDGVRKDGVVSWEAAPTATELNGQQKAESVDVPSNSTEEKGLKYHQIPDPPLNPYIETALEIGRLLVQKNEAYGDSFKQSSTFLKLLYPNGISADQMADALCLVRIIDKLFRVATKKDAFGESPYRDIAGYAILGATHNHERSDTAIDETASGSESPPV